MTRNMKFWFSLFLVSIIFTTTIAQGADSPWMLISDKPTDDGKFDALFMFNKYANEGGGNVKVLIRATFSKQEAARMGAILMNAGLPARDLKWVDMMMRIDKNKGTYSILEIAYKNKHEGLIYHQANENVIVEKPPKGSIIDMVVEHVKKF